MTNTLFLTLIVPELMGEIIKKEIQVKMDLMNVYLIKITPEIIQGKDQTLGKLPLEMQVPKAIWNRRKSSDIIIWELVSQLTKFLIIIS